MEPDMITQPTKERIDEPNHLTARLAPLALKESGFSSNFSPPKTLFPNCPLATHFELP